MRASEFLIEDNPDYDEDQFLKSDPGTPLSFPKGTTLVNVSDVYDWYKLGMAVSDLDDADPRTFNKGVPHTVFAFGSEEEEHKMTPLLKRLGFSLHDIDSPEDYEKAIRASDVMEHLEEMAGSIHGGVRQVLDKKGYRYLGGGIDKQAFLEPGTGQVLVIFGYNKAAQRGFSGDQMMFVDWAKYCKKNKANPHLPRFSDWASFDFQGRRYLQIRMEPLQELSDELKMIVVNLEEVAKYSRSNPKTAYKKIAKFANFDLLDAGEPDDLDHQSVVKNLGGEQAAYNLLKTVYEVKQFGKQHGFRIDLHGGNYM